MGDVYMRESRYREYEDPPSDDDRYKRTTVRRYKVKPQREDHYEDVEVDDDYRSHYSKRSEHPNYARSERPRSAFEPQYDDRQRSSYYERDVIERDYSNQKEADRGRITVYEGDKSDHDDRRSRYSRREDDVRVDRRVEYRADEHDHDVDHYRKETEYYSRPSPPPSPIVIRQPPREPQKIIVEEAPAPAPVFIQRERERERDRDAGAMVLREKERDRDREVVRRERRDEGDYYSYRHERYGGGGGHRDDDEHDRKYAMARYDRFHRGRSRSHSDGDDYYRRRVVRRERSESPQHKRQLAAGALAGAGLTALLNSRRSDHGDLPDHRGRKVVAGGALGALGTEAIRRAQSAYEDRHGGRDESPDDHSKLKKGLGIAAVALAAAGAAKYYQSNKIDKEESSRGRSRGRRRSHSGSSYSDSRSRSVKPKSKSRKRSMSTAAKAALGTAATAGIVQHFRDKSKGRSGSRGSRSRSKSRVRRAAEIGGAAAAAGVATKLWKNHKEKKEEKERSLSRGRSDAGSDYSPRGGASLSRSRSRSRSQARSTRRSNTGTDPELGLVEYGNDPLGPDPSRIESEAEERRRRRRRRRERSVSSDGSPGSRKRSQSRLGKMAAAGAAAFGIKEYKDRKDAEKREQQEREKRERRDKDLDRRERDDRDADRRNDRSRTRSRRRGRDDRDDESDPDGYFDDRPRRGGSPPVTSGGAYYPPYPQTPNGPQGGEAAAYTNFPDQSFDNQPYIPQDYTGYPPPPAPGPPTGFPAPPPGPPAPGPPPGPPPPGGNYPPDHVSPDARTKTEDGVSVISSRPVSPEPKEKRSRSKSVSFIPLSPKSSQTMEQHKRDHEAAVARGEIDENGEALQGGPGSDDHSLTHRSRYEADSESTSDVEDLADRFDRQGRPLDPSAPRSQWTTRSGEFERRPQKQGDWDVRGQWQVGGTDPEVVQKLVQGVTGALEGKQGWIGVVGSVLGSGLLGGPAGGQVEDGKANDDGDTRDERENRGRHRRR